MDTDPWKIENNICRCCHAEGYFFNLAEPRPFCGDMEVYADMLRDIFDIDMKPVPGPLCELTYTICMSCIFKLREAVQFKKQVQSCEDKFLDYYYTNKLEVTKKKETAKATIKLEPEIEFKEEYLNEDELDSNDGNTNQDYDLDDNSKSEEESEFLPTKGKGKGKGKSEQTEKRTKPATIIKTEQKTNKKNLVKVERIKVPVKKKDEKTQFRLQPEDFERLGDIFKCARCDMKYDKKEKLRYHIKIHHYKLPKYTCDVCKKEFRTLAPFTVHKYTEHDIDDRYKCNACKAIFNTKQHLVRHKNSVHMLGKKYKCDYCEYECYSFESLYDHKFKHKTVKEFHCKFCQKSFLRKSTLLLHEKIHTGDRRKICKECGKAFIQKSSLNYHMARHHPEVKF